MGLIDLKNAVLTIQDGSTNFIELHIGKGNLEWTEKRNIEFVLNRGQLGFTREGNEEPIEVSFEFVWQFIVSAFGESITAREALTQTGGASSWVSSTHDPLQPYSCNLVVVYTPNCGIKETIIIQDFYYEQLGYVARDASISAKGKANITKVTPTRG